MHLSRARAAKGGCRRSAAPARSARSSVGQRRHRQACHAMLTNQLVKQWMEMSEAPRISAASALSSHHLLSTPHPYATTRICILAIAWRQE